MSSIESSGECDEAIDVFEDSSDGAPGNVTLVLSMFPHLTTSGEAFTEKGEGGSRTRSRELVRVHRNPLDSIARRYSGYRFAAVRSFLGMLWGLPEYAEESVLRFHRIEFPRFWTRPGLGTRHRFAPSESTSSLCKPRSRVHCTLIASPCERARTPTRR